jgi:hypothetical protein
MIRAVEKLKLRALLAVTAALLRRCARRSLRLRRMLSEDSFVMQIRADDGVGGFFTVRDCRIRFRPGVHPNPDFAQIWRDSGAAVRALTNKDETELLRAIEDGRCRLQGSFLIALWFNEAMKLARG